MTFGTVFIVRGIRKGREAYEVVSTGTCQDNDVGCGGNNKYPFYANHNYLLKCNPAIWRDAIAEAEGRGLEAARGFLVAEGNNREELKGLEGAADEFVRGLEGAANEFVRNVEIDFIFSKFVLW